MLAPAGVPLHRTRAERFDDLVLQAVERLESRWEERLSSVEFAVEEIPPTSEPPPPGRGPVPLSRLEEGLGAGLTALPGPVSARQPRPDPHHGERAAEDGVGGQSTTGDTSGGALDADMLDALLAGTSRIVVYRRPLMARADSEDELGDLVFDVVVEEFARLVGVDPEDVDPGYSGGG